MNKFILGSYIGVFVGGALFSIGEKYSSSGTYGADLPVAILMILVSPAILGYLIGKESNN